MADTKSNLLAGKYRVEASRGRGGMAEVYKVWDPDRRAFVAMKVLHEFLADDPVFLARFQREARTLAKLEHPNIVRFFEFAHTGELAFILMEYIDGPALSHIRKRLEKPFTPGQILGILQPICAALHFAHGRGLVHCDIKSGNILLDRTGKILLSDFGIARSTDAATVTTMAGAGTPAYMSPEQIIGADPSPQMDIYALGVLIFELATGGKFPFTGDRTTVKGTNAEKIRWEKRNLPAPSPRQYNPDIAPELEGVILRCLQIEPSRRYKSVASLLEALAAAVGVPAEGLPQELLMPPENASDALAATLAAAQSKAKTPRWLYAAIGTVLFGVIALAAAYFMTRSASPAAAALPAISPTPVVLVVSATPGPATPTSPPPPPVPTSRPAPVPTSPPPPTSPPSLAWEYTKGSAGTYVVVHGGSPPVDRRYGPFRNGTFAAAANGKFGVYADNSGEVYVMNFSKDVTFNPFYKITKDQFTVLRPDIDDEPEYQLQLLADDNGTYRVEVTELKFMQTVVVEVPRAMSQ